MTTEEALKELDRLEADEMARHPGPKTAQQVADRRWNVARQALAGTMAKQPAGRPRRRNRAGDGD